MLLQILSKSISRRRSRVAIAVIAVIMGASVFGALVMTSMEVRDNVGLEFRQYGANILLVPQTDSISVSIGEIEYGSVTEQRYIEESDLPKIMDIYWAPNILGIAPYLYGMVKVDDQTVVLSGVNFSALQIVSPWWDIDGDWVDDNNDTKGALMGISVSEGLNLNVGDDFTVKYNNTLNETIQSFTVKGIVDTGGSEDYQIFIRLSDAQLLYDKENKVSTVQVSALCTACPVEVIAEQIEEQIVYVEAKSVKQMVNVEMQILGKVESLMFMVTAIALLASAMGVMTTMTTSVIERQKEIGMMKAIGAENRSIAALFYSEAVIIGILGGAIGYIVAIVLAQFIGASVFNSPISPNPVVLLYVLGVSIGVALLASVFPVRRAIFIEPARVLRGD